jgi:hypothetical protein
MFNSADRTRIEIKNDAAAIARWDDEGGASTPQTTNIPKDRDRRHSAPIGPNGNIIGAASDLRIRSQWQREGLPE